MVKGRFAAVPAVLAAAALAIAGCGGDDAPSKEEFATNLDKVCKRTSVKVAKLKRPRTLKEIAAYAEQSRGLLETSVREAQALELPKENRKEFKAYILSSKESLSALDEIEQAAKTKNGRTIRKVFLKTAAENKKRDAQAKKLGLKQCGASS